MWGGSAFPNCPAESAGAVEETLDLLDLTERADVPIGKLSGGQRKRASVGVELLCKPAILFLDEPTSGLDPGAESKLMHTLHQLAALGKTIVCTTHIMENVERFDKIAVLAPGGKLAFFGPPHDVLEFFGVAKFLDLYERLEEESPRVWQETFRRNRLFRKLRAHVHRERLPRPVHQQTPRLSPPPISSLRQALDAHGAGDPDPCERPASSAADPRAASAHGRADVRGLRQAAGPFLPPGHRLSLVRL